MKKIFLIAALLVSIFFIFWFSLSYKTKEFQQTAETSAHTNKETINLVFAHHMPKESLIHKAALRFASEVERKTNSKVKVTVYPNQELGNSHKMLELSRSGDIDIVFTATAKVSLVSPSMQYADLPFLFPSREDAYALLDGEVGAMLFKDLSNADLIGASFWDGGYKNITSNRAVTKLEDFKNLKVRIMKSSVIMEQYSALGAKPITIDFHETKQALKDGVVDAQENPLSEIVRMGFYKVQSDLTLSEHSYLPYVLTFSKKSTSKLPLNIQNILLETAKEVAIWEREETQKENKELLTIIKDAGVNIHTLSKKEKERLKKATSHIIKKYEDVLGSHIVSKTEEYLYKKYNKDDVVVIGVDADLSMGAKGSGLAIKRGVELAVDDINRQGGLLGKKVLVIAKDHQGISTQARENIKEFIEDKNTLAVIGGKHSAIISSYMKDIQDNKLIFFSPWAASPSVTQNGYEDNYVFRVSINDIYAAKFLAKEALKTNKKPAIIVENSVWGKGALKNINLYLESIGLPKEEGIIINRGEGMFEKYFAALKMKKYDSIIMVLNSQESKKLVEQLWKNEIFIPIISHWGMVGDSFFQADKNYLKDIDIRFIQTFSFLNHHNKEAKNLRKNYIKSYSLNSDGKINAVTGVSQAYDSVMLIASAVKKCKSLDQEKVKAALEDLGTYDGILERYKKPFNKTDHDALKIDNFFMAKFDEDGNIIPITEQ